MSVRSCTGIKTVGRTAGVLQGCAWHEDGAEDEGHFPVPGAVASVSTSGLGKKPSDGIFSTEKLTLFKGIFPWWRVGNLPCLDTGSTRVERSGTAHLYASMRTQLLLGVRPPQAFWHLIAQYFGAQAPTWDSQQPSEGYRAPEFLQEYFAFL